MSKYLTPQEISEVFKRACAEAKARDKHYIEDNKEGENNDKTIQRRLSRNHE